MSDREAFTQMVLARLERISADSALAHRASGVRGSLLRSLDAHDAPYADREAALIRSLDAALDLLRRAAAAVPGNDEAMAARDQPQ